MLASKPGVAKSRETLAVHAVQAPAAAGVATAVALAAQYGFTPAESLLGGLTLGVLASSKFAITGRCVMQVATAWKPYCLMSNLASLTALPIHYTVQDSGH